MVESLWKSRIQYFGGAFSTRVARLFNHIISIFRYIWTWDGKRLLEWPLDSIFLTLDVFGVPEFYEILVNLFKSNLRTLSPQEIRIAKNIFGESIEYNWVRLDEHAVLGPKQGRFAYVSFNTINSYGRLSNHILIHELLHVWQFQHLGSVYIWKALWAQRSLRKYDYGGLQELRRVVKANGSLLDFNFEQQGDIIADYYLLRNGQRPQWSDATYDDFPVYEYFIKEVNRYAKNQYA